MLNRKVKKLIRDPKLFFSDMVKKQKKKINSIQPKEYNGNYQYTVVTAVYNVGRYLDEYFNSMVKQRLDFKKHINLILVDDGSTDESAEIIKSWKKVSQ
ncbi:glycosyltransferase [Rahnella sp. ChDrAdgB13]|uniref:glycosyltransferase n=1 Tax=Rahnella sp. ChDrAdgB13 TaxID=1850581 RepID=UPI001AD8707E|nr:glycosyltransferase [Rahnella sp. ChDrAdgB13]